MPFLRDARGGRARGDLLCLLVRYQLRVHPDDALSRGCLTADVPGT